MKIAASVTSAGPIRVRACVFPVLFAALLSGCSLWGGSKVKLPELGENVPLLGVRQAWSAKVGGGAKPLDVRVQEHLVTIAAADGSVAALDARTGGDLWRTNVGEPLSAGLVPTADMPPWFRMRMPLSCWIRGKRCGVRRCPRRCLRHL